MRSLSSSAASTVAFLCAGATSIAPGVVAVGVDGDKTVLGIEGTASAPGGLDELTASPDDSERDTGHNLLCIQGILWVASHHPTGNTQPGTDYKDGTHPFLPQSATVVLGCRRLRTNSSAAISDRRNAWDQRQGAALPLTDAVQR